MKNRCAVSVGLRDGEGARHRGRVRGREKRDSGGQPMTQPTGGRWAGLSRLRQAITASWECRGTGSRSPSLHEGVKPTWGSGGTPSPPRVQGTHASLPRASCEPPTWNRGQDSACLLCSGAQVGFQGDEHPQGGWQRVRMGRPGAPNDVQLSPWSPRLTSSFLLTSPSLHVPTGPHRPPELSWMLWGVKRRAFVWLVQILFGRES